MKKILISILLISILCIPLFACSVNSEVKKTTVRSDDIALLTLFTFDGTGESKFGLKNLGHSFLGIENIGDEDITIGKSTLSPLDSLTFGTWSIQAHFGVWYNVESEYIRTCNKYDGRISITTGINSDDLAKINSFINSHDYWTPTNNCSNFALNLWNTIADKEEELLRPFIYSPSHIANCLKNFENYETNKNINTSILQMYFYDENTPKYFSLEV